jgi:hypothetical protein
MFRVEEYNERAAIKQADSAFLLTDPKDGGDTFLRNVG